MYCFSSSNKDCPRKEQRRTPILLCTILLLSLPYLILLPQNIFSETPHTRLEQFGDLQFVLPAGYALAPNTPQGTLAFRNQANAQAPVITIVEMQGEKQIRSENRKLLDKETLHSYRLVGLTDVKLLQSRIGDSPLPRYEAELEYTLSKPLFAILAILANNERHYIVTLSSQISLREETRSFAESLFQSLSFKNFHAKQFKDEKGRSWAWLVLLPGIFLLLLVICWRFRSLGRR